MDGASGSSAGRTDCVMRPTSPAATFVPISLSSSVVFPWSTCASTAITGVEGPAVHRYRYRYCTCSAHAVHR